MNFIGAGNAAAAWLQSGPWFEAASHAASLPPSCQLAISQTAHICLGWTPPFSLVPGLGLFRVCWLWFGMWVLVGLLIFLLLAPWIWLLWRGLVRKSSLSTSVPAPRGQTNVRRASTGNDAKLELLQLLVLGGHDVLCEVASQRGLAPADLLREFVVEEPHEIPHMPARAVAKVLPFRNPAFSRQLL